MKAQAVNIDFKKMAIAFFAHVRQIKGKAILASN